MITVRVLRYLVYQYVHLEKKNYHSDLIIHVLLDGKGSGDQCQMKNYNHIQQLNGVGGDGEGGRGVYLSSNIDDYIKSPYYK